MWNIIRADEFCESVRDGTHDTPKPVENGFKLVTSKHILNGRVYPEDAYCISEKDFKKINERSKVDKWDVLMSMIGNGLGKSAIIDYTPDFAIKNIALFKIGNEAKAKWLHYFLSSNYAQNVILNYLQGTGQPFLSLNLIRGFKIWNPPNTILEKIVKILSCYDEAIENNNKRIKLLEQMAQNLYKEWFVRFRFPGWENCEFENGIPVGWHQGRLSELLEFKRGKNITADEMEDGDVSVISAGLEPSGYHSTSNVQGVSLTISSSGANAGYLSIHYEDIWAADCMFITEKNTQNIYYLYELLNNIRLVIFNQQRGAAQPHVYSKDINNLRLWIPNEELIENANKLFESFHKEIYQLQRANKNLAKQRDLLLPRLMSGKLEVD